MRVAQFSSFKLGRVLNIPLKLQRLPGKPKTKTQHNTSHKTNPQRVIKILTKVKQVSGKIIETTPLMHYKKYHRGPINRGTIFQVDSKLAPQYLTQSLQTPVRGSWDHGPSVL